MAPTLSRDVTRDSGRVDSDSPAPPPALGPSILSSRPRPHVAGHDAAAASLPDSDADRRPHSRLAEHVDVSEFADEEAAMAEAMTAASVPVPEAREAAQEAPPKKRKPNDDPLSDGVMAALSKLRKT